MMRSIATESKRFILQHAFVRASAMVAMTIPALIGTVACGDFATSDVEAGAPTGPAGPGGTPGAPVGDAPTSGAPGGEFGATQGGVQDMSFARELIDNNQVPPPEAFVVEGMFSEHDLGLSGAACETLLCLRGAAGMAPTVAGEPSGWLQVGMSSTINPDEFERPSQTIIATVDVSGSMGWDYSNENSEYPTPGALSRRLLSNLVEQLDARDRIAIVTYGSTVDTVLSFTTGDQQQLIVAAIDSLDTNGSTNMEAGLQRAYEMADQVVGDGETDQTRIILFTDVQPNVGATSPSDFENMVTNGAKSDIGITVVGVGLGLGQQILNAMSHVRGGNAFSLSKYSDVNKFMDDNWPWFVSPIAYELSMKVAATTGFAIQDTYGIPEGTEEEAGFDVSTVFLSKRKGALLLRIAPEAADDAGSPIDAFHMIANLRYETVTGETITEKLDVRYDGQEGDDRGHYYEQPSTAKTVALALLVDGMHRAAERYAEEPDAAVELMTAVRDRFVADADRLEDPVLDSERKLADSLLALMEQGAPQGSLYPQ